jgi:succinate dehydrogenase/fumarate reductase flavoprotein subunit
MTLPPYDTLETDVLILGSGGAGLCAALHLADARPAPRVLLAVKGLFGKSGCTRMVQGGYNVVLRQPDSLEAHFRDTVSGGQWLNDQELAWLLVKEAPGRVLELENRAGCFFDRNPDGTVHQKPFAGQTHDRTVHKGDLTGIEIVNRLSEQVAATPNTTVLEELRAVELLQSHGGGRIVGALLLDQRTGRFVAVNARATLLATGGGPTMYRIAAPCHDKTCDGIAMAWRAGATLMDMEMVQFHPTGLLAANAQITGTVLEEGLRGAGAHLRNALGERFMGRYDAREERATRDVVSRSGYQEIMAGRGTPEGGVWLDISHLGADFVLKNFRGMTLRCRDVGYDLATEPVLVSPTAHFLMGGVVIDTQCRAGLEGLYVAGEDAGGVHGANRLGGNGVAESTVFGGLAGDVIAARLPESPLVPWDASHVALAMEHCLAPFRRGEAPPVYPLRERLRELMWVKAGLVRDAAQLAEAAAALAELREGWRQAGVPGGPAYNLAWMDWLNLENWLDACETIVAGATARSESRGSHYRSDHPQHGGGTPYNLLLRRGEAPERRPVRFTRLRPEAAG